VTLRQAQADVNVIAHRFAQQRPKDYPKQFSIQVDTWIDRLVGQFSSFPRWPARQDAPSGDMQHVATAS